MLNHGSMHLFFLTSLFPPSSASSSFAFTFAFAFAFAFGSTLLLTYLQSCNSETVETTSTVHIEPDYES